MERSLIGVAAPARRTVHGRFNAARVPVPIPRWHHATSSSRLVGWTRPQTTF